MSINSMSFDDFSWEFSSETSLPISVSHNGREITLEEAQFLKDTALQQITELIRSQFSPDSNLIQVLQQTKSQDISSFGNPCVSKKWHIWRNITHFCKHHKKEILIALAVIAVVATVATAIIYGTSAATGAGAAAAGGSAAGANDCESDKKKGSSSARSEPISSSENVVIPRISSFELPQLSSLAVSEIDSPKTDSGTPSLFITSSTNQAFVTLIPENTFAIPAVFPQPSTAPTAPFIPAYPNDPFVDRLLSEQASSGEIKNTFLELFASCRQSQEEVLCYMTVASLPQPHSIENNTDFSLVEKVSNFGAILAHETLDGISELAYFIPQTAEEIREIGTIILPGCQDALASPMENYGDLIAAGHREIDKIFSTEYAENYTAEARAGELEIDFNIGAFPPPGMLSASSINPIELLEAGAVADRAGLTRAGRALMKHGYREGTVFSKPIGTVEQINQYGQNVLNEIITDPKISVYPNRFGGKDIFAPSGKGARFDGDGNFMGFLQPRQ